MKHVIIILIIILIIIIIIIIIILKFQIKLIFSQLSIIFR